MSKESRSDKKQEKEARKAEERQEKAQRKGEKQVKKEQEKLEKAEKKFEENPSSRNAKRVEKQENKLNKETNKAIAANNAAQRDVRDHPHVSKKDSPSRIASPENKKSSTSSTSSNYTTSSIEPPTMQIHAGKRDQSNMGSGSLEAETNRSNQRRDTPPNNSVPTKLSSDSQDSSGDKLLESVALGADTASDKLVELLGKEADTLDKILVSAPYQAAVIGIKFAKNTKEAKGDAQAGLLQTIKEFGYDKVIAAIPVIQELSKINEATRVLSFITDPVANSAHNEFKNCPEGQMTFSEDDPVGSYYNSVAELEALASIPGNINRLISNSARYIATCTAERSQKISDELRHWEDFPESYVDGQATNQGILNIISTLANHIAGKPDTSTQQNKNSSATSHNIDQNCHQSSVGLGIFEGSTQEMINQEKKNILSKLKAPVIPPQQTPTVTISPGCHEPTGKPTVNINVKKPPSEINHEQTFTTDILSILYLIQDTVYAIGDAANRGPKEREAKHICNALEKDKSEEKTCSIIEQSKYLTAKEKEMFQYLSENRTQTKELFPIIRSIWHKEPRVAEVNLEVVRGLLQEEISKKEEAEKGHYTVYNDSQPIDKPQSEEIRQLYNILNTDDAKEIALKYIELLREEKAAASRKSTKNFDSVQMLLPFSLFGMKKSFSFQSKNATWNERKYSHSEKSNMRGQGYSMTPSRPQISFQSVGFYGNRITPNSVRQVMNIFKKIVR